MARCRLSQAEQAAPVAGIRVGDMATRAGDLRNRKQQQRRRRRRRRRRTDERWTTAIVSTGEVVRSGRCRGHAGNWTLLSAR